MKTKVDGSILSYALVLMVIVAIILSSLILLSYYNQTIAIEYRIADRLRLNAESGINKLLVEGHNLNYGQSLKIDLYGEAEDSVLLKKSNWGLLDLYSAKAYNGSKIRTKKVLAGGFYRRHQAYALKLLNSNRPLCLVGYTKITGNVSLPRGGLKRGYVDGRHFIGDTLIRGIVSLSPDKFQLNEEIIKLNSLDSILNKITDDQYDFQLLNEVQSSQIANSFHSPTGILYHKGNYVMEELQLKGNLIVLIDGSLIIGSSFEAEDVLIYAKTIYIESGSALKAQIIASDSLIVMPECTFGNPSVLAVLQTDHLNKPAYLDLGQNTSLEGNIIYWNTTASKNQYANLRIRKGSVIKGQIYSSGYIEMEGTLKGSLQAAHSLIRRPNGNYINHLLDVDLSYPALDMQFVSMDINKNNNPYKTIKCLR